MNVWQIIERMDKHELLKIAMILSMHLPIDYLNMYNLILKFGSLDVAVQAVHIAHSLGRDPNSFTIDETINLILNEVTNEKSDAV